MNYKKQEIKEYLEDSLKDYDKSKIIELVKEGELHHEIFNTDYYIIGTYKAKKWCKDNVFNIIEEIKEYEQSNFGEVTTDFSSSESVVNMFVYILGEHILSDCNLWEITNGGGELKEWQINHIKENLNQLVN